MTSNTIPFLIAGPILRKATSSQLVFWLVTREPLKGTFQLFKQGNGSAFFSADLSESQSIQVGTHAFVTLAKFESDFPTNAALNYQFDTQFGDLTQLTPHLLYGDEKRLSIIISDKADYIVHGSCRNPHDPCKDALVVADKKVETQALHERPDLLMMSGDQIYADHVAGPTLDVIDQVIDLLGLPKESFSDSPVADCTELRSHPDFIYGRDRILPHYVDDGSLLSKFFPHRHAPIFTSTDCENHLITFSEFFAMYLLVWSPELWSRVNRTRLLDQGFVHNGKQLDPKWQQKWREEKKHIDGFVAGLHHTQRLLAHIPTYMIFDDHDVTDDWNLTIGWEKAAYENPFSKRIIGNGLLSYWLCQGWGNEPDNFNQEFLTLADAYFADPSCESQDAFIQHLYTFEKWHYTIHTSPKVVVLDTRTRRWRSESRMNKPSGLMDWEAMIEFHQELVHQDKVIIVSAAPIFGVKFIEALQRVMTSLGYPLVVDAENWMAHPGSANTLLSIFTHTKTPTNFVILSGDVHYSFAYDIKLRFRKCSPNIFQITCSGIKNNFPEPLLGFCDHADRLLYSPRSLLNFFTKRKRMKIKKRKPSTSGARKLVNASAIGELRLDPQGKPKRVSILTAEGQEIDFPPIEEK